MSLNLEQARFNMVEQQVRTWEVLDPRVLEVLRSVPREDFVPSRYRKLAFSDLRIPLACGQLMMKPLEEGRMLQALAIQPGERVLEIGTGSGFTAACLAALGADVVSLEIHAELAESAHRRLKRAGYPGIEIIAVDACDDFTPAGLFDAVVLTASAAEIPAHMLGWVRTGGRLFGVRGQGPAMEAVCLHQRAEGRWLADSLFETDLPRLIGAEDRPVFQF
jgi:protein-L-isoaspartate(D-aspartate) O-methyltransferase